jgi:hypothetical protein
MNPVLNQELAKQRIEEMHARAAAANRIRTLRLTRIRIRTRPKPPGLPVSWQSAERRG